MSIGDNIKKWRELRSLKQSELAALIGVSDKTVSSWEINRTEPKMGMVEKICKALNCKKTDIIGVDVDEDDLFKNKIQPDIILTLYDNSEIYVDLKRTSQMQEERLSRLLKYYSLLNEIGQKKALDNLEDLTKIYNEGKTIQYNLSSVQSSKVAETPAPYNLVAAHNDCLDEESEMEKIRSDLSKLRRPQK